MSSLSYWVAAGSIFCTMLFFPCFAVEHRIDSQEKFTALCKSTFSPGDLILFKRGARFTGMFSPSGNGTDTRPIKVDVYGTGKRPRIDAGGKRPAAILLQNPSYWEINGLELTNTSGDKKKDQGALFGIRVLATGTEGTYRHIYINDCYVHDVNGMVPGKRRGGIHVHVEKLKSTKFHDLQITNNRISRVGGVGIGNSSSCGDVNVKTGMTKNLWTKVYVAGNYVDTTGRNNVIARVSKDAIYEHNILANSSRKSTGHSIFCFDTDGIKIQYNEAYGNVGDEDMDRGGFDADYNCINTFIQYNYSHDNMWFCGIMKKPNSNVVIRYNISQNDRKGIYFYGFERSRNASNIHIYNNTHFVRKGLKVQVFPNGRTPINSTFENNIFYFEEHGSWGKNAKGKNTKFRNNLYFNITPHKSDNRPIVGDPLFAKAGAAGTDINLKTMDALRGYRVKPGSACIDKGLLIKRNGGIDLLKIRITGKPDIGAFEFRP